ncbi:methyl-accepting chemotaxis protein [Kineothrix alysoides]|uniref:Methyl-accepting chemotaxis protein n=1 Tax=Kineothrix alysoides TaxID=1469948 RepID=A0A4R1QVG1_9FIRM|nr:methyl-accepting chemotaxis protein [Kineothrix alysoides]TCL57938.1 methyl-accepting chemotaxis protein [Kineothrix alysoides]
MIKSKRIRNKWKKNLFSTIRFKLTGSYCLLIGFIIIAGVSAYTSASGAIKANYKTSTLQSLDMLGEYLEFGFDTVSGAAVEYLSDTNVTDYLTGGMAAKKADQSIYYTDKKSEITTKVTADAFLQSIYLFSDPVSSLSTNKKSVLNMFSDYTRSEQGKTLLEDSQAYYWFGKSSIIDEALNVDSNNYAIRMIKAFYRKEAFLVMDIDKQAVTDILNKMQMGEGCRIAFVTGDGVELSEDGSRETFFFGTDFYERARAAEESIGTMENVLFEGRDYLFLYRRIADTGAMVCVLIPESEITGQVKDIKYLTFFVILASVLIALLIGGGIAAGINRAIKYFTDKMEIITTGDISIRLHTNRKDEFGTLAKHMNHMLESMNGLMGNVKAVSLEAAQSAQNVVKSSETISESAAYISAAIGQIEQGLFEQANDTKNGVEKLESLANHIGIVDRETMEIREIAGGTTFAIGDSIDRMHILKEKTEETSAITQKVIESINELKVKSGLIGGIVDTIDSISEETTLLSLNAAIEAARAGVAGRGFAIVADSIKKLADQSLAAANQIRSIVDEIKEETVRTVNAANDAGEVITYQEIAVEDMRGSFNGMKAQVEALVKKVEAIVSSIERMRTEKEESVNKMEHISEVTAEAFESITAANGKTKNQVQIVEELSMLSEKMLYQVEQLETALGEFHV